MKKKKSGKIRSKGLLVKRHLEKASSELFELIGEKLKKLLKGQSGIYVLYKNNTIYYIGLARDLRKRVEHHLEDRHKNRWDKFSLYIVKRIKYLRDIESLMLRLVRPKGNKLFGHFDKQGNLKLTIKSDLKDLQRALNKVRE